MSKKLKTKGTNKKRSNYYDNWFKSFITGVTVGLTSVIVGYPLDTIKTRIQTHAKQRILSNLYRGSLSPLLIVPAGWSVMFSTYHTAYKRNILKLHNKNSLNNVMVSGFCAGFVYPILGTPFETVKCFSQRYHVTSIETVNILWNKFYYDKYNNGSMIRGVNSFVSKGLYRGYTTCLLKDTSCMVAYFLALELCRRHIPGYHDSTIVLPFITGVINGIVCWSVMLPFDCIKSIVQTEFGEMIYKIETISQLPKASFRYNFKEFTKKYGYISLYKGYKVVMIRNFVVSGTCIVVLETLCKHIYI